MSLLNLTAAAAHGVAHAGLELSLDDLDRKNNLDEAMDMGDHDNAPAVRDTERENREKHRARAERFGTKYVEPKVGSFLEGNPGARLTDRWNCLPSQEERPNFKGQLGLPLGAFSYEGENTVVLWASVHNGRWGRASFNVLPTDPGRAGE